jgi:hypothetical protein
VSLLAALVAAGALVGVAFPFLFRHTLVIVLTVFAALAMAFATHSSLSVALEGGAEFATDTRIVKRIEQLGETAERLGEERGGVVVVEGSLAEALAWPLRDSPLILGGESEMASVVIAPADRPPFGFEALGDAWRVSEGWYPEEALDPLSMWRWMLHREPYGNAQMIEARIYVPTP